MSYSCHSLMFDLPQVSKKNKEKRSKKILIHNEIYAGLVDAYAAAGMSSSVFNRFRILPICRNMEVEECMDLFNCFEVRQAAVGEVIYETNAISGRTMHLIVDGVVSVYSDSPSTGDCSWLEEGDVLGLLSFLNADYLRPAKLKSESDVTLLSINREYFNVITLEDPALGNQLLRFMFRLLSRMSLKLESEYAAMFQDLTGRHI